MSLLYIRKKVLPDNLFEDILYHLDNITSWKDATIYNKRGGRINEKTRKTKLHAFEPDFYPDIDKYFRELIHQWNYDLNPEEHYVRELSMLKYEKRDHFVKHLDLIDDGNSPRVFSTTTVLTKSDDLEGGDFLIYPDGNSDAITVDLDVGDTIFFDSAKTYHQVNKIKKGSRQVLVAWIHKRRYNKNTQ